MATPSLGPSLAAGLRAAARTAWLLPVGALVAAVRAVATVPALVVAVALAVEGAGRAARLRPSSLAAPLEGVAVVAASPRFLALVAGLWLAGTLLAGLLRVLFLAGALPTLGARLAGVEAAGRFAPGVAWGFPRQLGTWLLAAGVELAATAYLVAVSAAAGWLALAARRPLGAVPLALAGAAALATALGGLVASRVLADSAAARTAILGEGPAAAFGGALRRLVERPGTFLVAGLGLFAAALAMSATLQPATGFVAAVGERVGGLVAAGPRFMLALLAFLGAAAVDLIWLATVGGLACGERAEPPRP